MSEGPLGGGRVRLMSILAASLPQRIESGLAEEARSRARIKSFLRSQHPAEFAAGLDPNNE
jgi:hypothetical protein